MSFRIEISFVGDAPEDELARATIIGNREVQQAMQALTDILGEAGLQVKASAKSVRAIPRKNPRARAAAVLAAAAE